MHQRSEAGMKSLHQSRKVFKHCSMWKCPRLSGLHNHVCQLLRSLSGIRISQSSFFLQRSWGITSAMRMKGATNPRGTYTELIADNSPLTVAGLSLMLMLKLKIYELICYWSPRALSMMGWSKSRFFTFSLRDWLNHLTRARQPFCETEGTFGHTGWND